jgi:hypothetical protein
MGAPCCIDGIEKEERSCALCKQNPRGTTPMNMLFNEHLRRTSAEARFTSAPMLCEDVTENVLVDAITDFANSLSSVLDWLDLGTAFDSWCESNELSDEAISVFQETISEAAEQRYGNANDDSVRSLL